ncbi:MAG: hypothetical protein RL653_261 [Pseudomonadota bacterium]
MSGLPLLMLHGFTGSGSSFQAVAPLLGDRTLITPDLPGHGAAGRQLPTAGRAGFFKALDELAALLERSGQGQVDLFGYSMGARLALAFALRFPGRVRRLVLESGSPGLRTRRQRLNRRRADERLARGIEREGVDAFIRRWEQLPLFAGLRALPAEAQAQLRDRRTGQSTDGLAWALRSLGTGVQPSQWARLGQVRPPVLVLAGLRDEKFTRLARAMADRLPDARLRLLPGAFHVPHLEVPQAWASEVRGFLD